MQNLQIRQKWNKSTKNMNVGDIVLMKDDDLPRCHWRLGKVVDLYTSTDKKVRSVRLLMGDRSLSKSGRRIATPSYLDRPIQKLVLLMESED